MQYQAVTRLPDCCVFLGTQNSVFAQHRAVHEAAKLQIVTVGVVDTNSDPRLITYPVPGNDDSPTSIKLFCDLFKVSVCIAFKFEMCIKRILFQTIGLLRTSQIASYHTISLLT